MTDDLRGSGTPESDRRLVDRCLVGDQRAWDELYQQCHARLILVAVSVLGCRPDRWEVSDEIAARAWFRILADNYALLRDFDDTRGSRLHHYLGAVCRNVALNYRKAEKRRKAREVTVNGADVTDHNTSLACDGRPPAEFINTLTPRERQFCEGFLLEAHASGNSEQYSESNVRQLKSRIRRKLQRWLNWG